MRIEFLGHKETRKTGCVPCGKRKTSNVNFKRDKKMFLPSGRSVFFIVGKVEEVNGQDGEFLLEQTYQLNGKSMYMFKEVK